MKVDRIGVGVVGCGFVGRGAHIPAFHAIDDAELVAIADPVTDRRDSALRKYSVRSSYQGHRELIEDPAVHLVVVAVPTPLHAEVAQAAMEAGKHVLCEMPLAADLEQADKLLATARRHGVVLMPSLTFRFTPNFAKMKQLLSKGSIGSPVAFWYREFIAASDLAAQWPAGSWMWDLKQSGGPLYTLSVWSIDLMRWLAGSDMEQIQATVKYTPLSTYGTLGYNAAVMTRMANGVMGCLQYSGSVAESASSCVMEVAGDSTGVLRALNNDRLVLLGDEPARMEWNLKQPGPRMWGHQAQNEHLVQCIKQSSEPDVSPEDGLRAMQLAMQIADAG